VLLEEQRRALDQQRTMLRARINALLGRGASEPLPPPAGLPEPGGLPDIELLRAAITREHPELSQLEHAIAGAGARAQLAELALRPNFDLNVGYNQLWMDRDLRLMIGVGINVPVQRAPRRAELDAALAERRRAEYLFAEQTAVLLARLETAYASSVQALEVIGLHQERLLVLVDRHVEAALTAYQSGESPFLNVVAAERQRLATRQSYERTRADYRRAVAELELAAGGSLDLPRNSLSVR
jgi:outer membrane protein, heavy metal efflux system